MLRGMCTTSFYAADLDAANAWYSDLFQLEPYYVVEGGYLEWRLGDYEAEFGIVSAAYANPGQVGSPSGAVVYWAVDDVEATLERLLEKGATLYQPVTVRGEGFITAAVADPFDNILGVMFNQHYLDRVGPVGAGA